jgi:hypothetical protein
VGHIYLLATPHNNIISSSTNARMQAHFAVFFEAAAALFCKFAGRKGEPMPDNKTIAAKAISSTKTVHLVAAARAARPDLVDDALPKEFLGDSKHTHLSPREAADVAPAVVKFIAWLQGPGRGELRKCGSNQAAVLKVIEDLTKTPTRPMGGAALVAGVVADQLGTWARTDFAEPAPELMISGPFQWLDDGHPTKVVGPNNKEQLVHHFVWARPVVTRPRSPLLDCHASVRSAAVARARAFEMVRMRAEKKVLLLLLKELNEQEELKKRVEEEQAMQLYFEEMAEFAEEEMEETYFEQLAELVGPCCAQAEASSFHCRARFGSKPRKSPSGKKVKRNFTPSPRTQAAQRCRCPVASSQSPSGTAKPIKKPIKPKAGLKHRFRVAAKTAMAERAA